MKYQCITTAVKKITKCCYHKKEPFLFRKSLQRWPHALQCWNLSKNVKVDFSDGSSSWVLILSFYTTNYHKFGDSKWNPFLIILYVKYPHIWSLCSPSQIKAKAKHYIRIHACGSLLFPSEVMWLCWDLVSCRTRAKVKACDLAGV